MILSYDSLIKNINYLVRGASKDQIQSASVDVTLGDTFKVPLCSKAIVRLGVDKIDYETKFDDVIIKPHSFILATTKEIINVPDDMGAWIEGKSSIGRSGLFIQNAGWIAPGFNGEITLELYNANDYCLKIEKGISIGQVLFANLDQTTSKPYKGRYLNQTGATAPIPESYKTFDSVATVKILKKNQNKNEDKDILEFTITLLDIPYDEYSIHSDKRIAEALVGYNILAENSNNGLIELLNENLIDDEVMNNTYFLAEVGVMYDYSSTAFKFKLYVDTAENYKIVKAEYVKIIANATFGKPKKK